MFGLQENCQKENKMAKKLQARNCKILETELLTESKNYSQKHNNQQLILVKHEAYKQKLSEN